MILAIMRIHESMDIAVVDSYWSRSGEGLKVMMDEKKSTGFLDFLSFRLPISLVSFSPPSY